MLGPAKLRWATSEAMPAQYTCTGAFEHITVRCSACRGLGCFAHATSRALSWQLMPDTMLQGCNSACRIVCCGEDACQQQVFQDENLCKTYFAMLQPARCHWMLLSIMQCRRWWCLGQRLPRGLQTT